MGSGLTCAYRGVILAAKGVFVNAVLQVRLRRWPTDLTILAQSTPSRDFAIDKLLDSSVQYNEL